MREHILREKGTRYDPENLQEMPDFQGIKLHIAASVSYHHKSDLVLYNDENDQPLIKPQKPCRPRRRKLDTDEEWEQRLREWEASLPHEGEVKSKGNSMTQQYYADTLLPFYIRCILRAQATGRRVFLQEDGDPSHGARENKKSKIPNICEQLRRRHFIESHSNPAQSPDLNPIEACWGILFFGKWC